MALEPKAKRTHDVGFELKIFDVELKFETAIRSLSKI
jgi:hypothetical protein